MFLLLDRKREAIVSGGYVWRKYLFYLKAFPPPIMVGFVFIVCGI